MSSINRAVVTAGVLIAITASSVCCRAGTPAGRCAPPQISDTGGEDYYRNAYTLIDLPLGDLVEAVPELRGLVPAAGQQSLPRILSEVGKGVEESYQKFTEIVANEQVTQEQCGPAGRPKTTIHHEFNYLILPHHESGQVQVDEYRTNTDGKPAGGSIEGHPFTVGFASVWALFYPANQSDSKFRYLGQLQSSGPPMQVIAFAQKPGWSVIRSVAISEGQTIQLLNQGVAWIDAATHKIVRIRTDLLKPRLDVKLEMQTSEIRFGEIHVSDAASSPLWVPIQVIVTTVWNGQVFRDEHLYSHYRLPGSSTKIKSVPEETGPLPKTN